MSTPPLQPDNSAPHQANTPIDEQIDALLSKIEEVEPNTIDPTDLPPQPQSEQTADPATPSTTANEIESLLNSSPQVNDSTSPEPLKPAAETTVNETPEQAEMLAALNAALQGLNTDNADNPPAEPPTETASEADASASSSVEEELSMEEKLQQEIAALMNADPQVSPDPTTDAPTEDAGDIVAPEDSPEPAETLAAIESPPTNQPSPANTADEIAMEIEGLLQADPTQSTSNTTDQAEADDLDKLLAEEFDSDDELMGEFQSVEELTTGIQVDNPDPASTVDEHAATARDVAAELDSQPEDAPRPSRTPQPAATAAESSEDPFAVLSQIVDTAEENEKKHQRRMAMKMPNWAHWLNTFKAQSLNICFVINWPARRFLSNEWRATLGLVSLMVAGTSSLFLLGVLIFS